jgi:hypothetical protein
MKRLAMLLLTVVILTSCRGRENSITGSYGNGLLSGVVTVADGSSPAGIEVTASGMVMTLGEDGRFVFGGVRDNTTLHFRRASDGIEAQLATAAVSGLTVEVSARSASRRRGALPAAKEEQYEGLIREASATGITVFTSHGVEVEITIDANTIIRKGQTTVAPEDLKEGDRVHVKATTTDGVTLARQIVLQNAGDDDDDGDDEGQTMTANGLVVSVGETSLVVKSQPKGDVTVQVDASTIIKRQGERISLSDVKAGDEVNSMGKRVDETTLLARQIEVRGNSNPNNGKGRK